MVDITEISAIIAAAGVLVGVVYYALQMKEQTRLRKTSLMVTLYSWIQSDEYQKAAREVFSCQFKDYEDCVKKYGTYHSLAPIWTAMTKVLAPFDMLGTMLYRKHIDIEFAWDLFGGKVLDPAYDKLEPLLLGLRREFSEPGLMVGFEYLKEEFVKKDPQFRKSWEKFLSKRSQNNLAATQEMKKREQASVKSG